MMRKLMVLVMVLVVLAAMVGPAMAEHGGVIPPMLTMSWGGR